MSCTLPDIPDILNPAKIATLNFLPEKSKKVYQAAYDSFLQWRTEKNIDSFEESVLLEYVTELSAKYKPSSLWTTYSMLRSTINFNHGIDIESYTSLRNLLKRKSQGFQPKKASTFCSEDIKKFITEASDDKYLATKVTLIMGVMGACRATEMYTMTLDDLHDLGSAFLVRVQNTKTKITRKFTITDNFYRICKKYISLRPPNFTSNVFFLNFQNGKCTSQRIGINKFTQMGRQIATFLELPNPENYSGHSFRRSSATNCIEETRWMEIHGGSRRHIDDFNPKIKMEPF